MSKPTAARRGAFRGGRSLVVRQRGRSLAAIVITLAALLPVAHPAPVRAEPPAPMEGQEPEVARDPPPADPGPLLRTPGSAWWVDPMLERSVALAPPSPDEQRDGLTVHPSASVPAAVAAERRVVVTWSEPLTATAAKSSERIGRLRAGVKGDIRFVRWLGRGRAIYSADLERATGPLVEALGRVDGVKRVEIDRWVTPTALPDDPLAADLWGLLGPADGSPYGIDALEAWTTTRGAGVVVAVIDTGVVDHPDLAGRIVPGFDMVSVEAISHDGDGRDGDASDPGDWGCGYHSSWHGTHVAGTIVALADNAVGVFGGAPDARVQSVRALGSCGGYASDIGDAIRWAAGLSVAGAPVNPTPARVLNLSLGGDGECPSFVEAAIAEARAAGSVVVIAAGNSNADAGSTFPANCPGALTVAAIDEDGRRGSFSNHGPTVDVAAPGVDVWSTIDEGTTVPVGPTYASYAGTSMATPHVAATAALVASAYPGLDPDGIEGVIRVTAGPFAVDASIGGCAALGCGAGHADAAAAVVALDPEPPLVGAVQATPMQVSEGFIDIAGTAVDIDGIASATLTVDGGTAQAMSALDGAFGADAETVTVRIIAPATQGSHQLCVRARDTGQFQSPAACVSIVVDTSAPAIAPLSLSPGSVESGTPSRSGRHGHRRARHRPLRSSGQRRRLGTGRPDTGGPQSGLAGDPSQRPGDDRRRRPVPRVRLVDDRHGPVLGVQRHWRPRRRHDDGARHPVDDRRLDRRHCSRGRWVPSCALLGDGTVRCWGLNDDGQLGDGTTIQRLIPVAVSGLTGVTGLTAGAFHTCALLGSGDVRCWGYNAYGGLGNGGMTASSVPVAVAGLDDATAIAAGGFHTCALRGGALPRCWGCDAYGQIGNGGQTDQTSPVDVPGAAAAVEFAGGLLHTCVRLADGTARCWGYNGAGGVGAVTSTLCGGLPCALEPVAVSGLGQVARLAIGGYFSCARLTDGTVRCWGDNIVGSLGDGTTDDRISPVPVFGGRGVVALTAGRYHACAALTDGAVRCWGLGLNGQVGNGDPGIWTTPTGVLGLDGPLGAGARQVCMRATDPAGNRSSGTCANLTVTDTAAPVARLVAPPGRRSSAGRRSTITSGSTSRSRAWPPRISRSGGAHGMDGRVDHRNWGGPDRPPCRQWDAVRDPDPDAEGRFGRGPRGARRAIDGEGCADRLHRPHGPGCHDTDPVPDHGRDRTRPGLDDGHRRIRGRRRAASPRWRPVAGDGRGRRGPRRNERGVRGERQRPRGRGRRRTRAFLRRDEGRLGPLLGGNAVGQLGDGTTTQRTTSVRVAGITDAVAVAAGNAHTCALLSSGTVRCWGLSAYEASPLGPGAAPPSSRCRWMASRRRSLSTRVPGIRVPSCRVAAFAAGGRTCSASSGMGRRPARPSLSQSAA